MQRDSIRRYRADSQLNYWFCGSGVPKMLNLNSAVLVEFPLKGEWAATATPAERVPSHGTDYLGQAFAFDFYRLAPGIDLPYRAPVWRHLFATIPAEACYCWDEPVYAATAGMVIDVGEGWPDRRRINLLLDFFRGYTATNPSPGGDLRPLAGNYVIIEGNEGVAFYAHLRSGSIRVRKGQRVACGDELGSVGNSGNSTMPHLHFHLMDRADPHSAAGKLCAFRRYERYTRCDWELVESGVPGLLERIRAIELGAEAAEPIVAADSQPK